MPTAQRVARRFSVLVVGVFASLLGVAAAASQLPPLPPSPPPPPPPATHPYREPGYTGTTIYVDEDTFMFPTTDQDYTTGIQFTIGGRFAKTLGPPLRALDWFTPMKRLHDGLCPEKSHGFCPSKSYQAHALVVGLTFFTPRKGEADDPECEIKAHGCILALAKPLHDDRPYASILYATVSRETARGKTAWLSDFTIGVLGLNIGRDLQTWYHTGYGHDVKPGGWGYQISQGGEPTLKYRAVWRRLLASGFWRAPARPSEIDYALPGGDDIRLPRRWFDLTTDVEANAGFYTNLAAGAKIRISPFGKIDSPFWGAQRHPVVPSLRLDKGAPARPKIREAYLWASGGGTAWAYNALIQGQFKHSEVTLPYAAEGDPRFTPLRRLVWDYQLGATVRLGPGLGFFKHLGLTYQYNRHSALFGGGHSRQHAWGGIYIGIYPELSRHVTGSLPPPYDESLPVPGPRRPRRLRHAKGESLLPAVAPSPRARLRVK